MYLDAVKEIQALEASLAQEKARARAQAQAAEDAAEQCGRALLEQTRRTIRAQDAADGEAQALRQAQVREEILRQARQTCDELRQNALTHMDQAVDRIVGKVVGR